MAEPIGIGIVGCGDVLGGYVDQIDVLRGQGRIGAIVACDVREERRQHVLQEFGIAEFTVDYNKILMRDDIDVVLVLTPMPSHGVVAGDALAAGKHVLVEKPMAVTLEEAARLVELSKRSKGYLVCAPHVILSPTYRAIARRIADGQIGKVLTARARYGWSGSWWSDWFYRVGGGALFDLAVYNLTTLTGLLGPAKRVMAMTGVALREREIGGERIRVEAIDNAQVLIDFGECVFAAVTTGFTMQKYRGPALEFYGTEGTIQMLGDDWAPQGYELWQSGEESWRIFPETAPHWRWTDGLRHLVECVQRHEEPAVRPEHAYHVLELMLKAQESGRTGHSQLIESTFAPRTER